MTRYGPHMNIRGHMTRRHSEREMECLSRKCRNSLFLSIEDRICALFSLFFLFETKASRDKSSIRYTTCNNELCTDAAGVEETPASSVASSTTLGLPSPSTSYGYV